MPEKAGRWRNRYLYGGIPVLEKDASRPGRPRTVTEDRTAEVIHKTTQGKPFNATHWSTRSMAAATGLSEAYLACQWSEAATQAIAAPVASSPDLKFARATIAEPPPLRSA